MLAGFAGRLLYVTGDFPFAATGRGQTTDVPAWPIWTRPNGACERA